MGEDETLLMADLEHAAIGVCRGDDAVGFGEARGDRLLDIGVNAFLKQPHDRGGMARKSGASTQFAPHTGAPEKQLDLFARELATHLDIEPDLVLEALETAGVYATVPMPTSAEGVELELPMVEEDYDTIEVRATLQPLLANLPPRERRILVLRFVRNLSQSQIAAEVGLSQMHVSRLIARSLATLRRSLNPQDLS